MACEWPQHRVWVDGRTIAGLVVAAGSRRANRAGTCTRRPTAAAVAANRAGRTAFSLSCIVSTSESISRSYRPDQWLRERMV